MWHGRGNSGGSWPPAFPRSQEEVGEIFLIFPLQLKKENGCNIHHYMYITITNIPVFTKKTFLLFFVL